MTERICELNTPEGGTAIPFRLKRSSRNRYLRVTVRDTGDVVLSVPDDVSDSGAVDFLRSQAEWLLETLGRVPPAPKLVDHLRAEPWISLDGRKAHVMLDEAKIRTHWVANPERGETIIRYVMGAEKADSELITALVDMAKRYVPERVGFLAKKVGARVGRVRIRDQRTLWGSCTSDGNLSLNWRIILLPPHLHDHIIYHELAHLKHLDHSRAFYRLLQSYDPDSSKNDHSISKLSPVFMGMGR